MHSKTETYLWSAGEKLGHCAALIKNRKTSGGQLSASEQDLLIGFGSAQDWLKWSSSLVSLQFKGRNIQRSGRIEGITESVRFSQMWTGTNTLFSCDPILKLIKKGELPTQELERFKLLYGSAAVDSTLETACLKALHDLLGMECKAEGLQPTLGLKYTYPTMWEIIHHKYTRPEDHKRGIGRVIATALKARTLPVIDGPTLIYGTRNWTVHGVLLTSFFRGSRQKYLTYIANIQLLLAAALAGAANSIYSKI